MNLLKGWLSIGSKKPKETKGATVYAPLPGMSEVPKISIASGRAMDANVVPSTGLEWMDEKNQK